MKTLLFTPVTWNLAETTRMLAVARACCDRFECHFMGYGGEFVRLIPEAGFPYHALETQLAPQRIAELWKADRGERGGKIFTAEELIARGESELALNWQITAINTSRLTHRAAHVLLARPLDSLVRPLIGVTHHEFGKVGGC